VQRGAKKFKEGSDSETRAEIAMYSAEYTKNCQTRSHQMLSELRRGCRSAEECQNRLGFSDLRFTPSKKAFRRSPELRQGSPETDEAPARVAGGRRSSGEGRRRLEAAACAREGGVAATTVEVAGCCYCVMLFAVASATKRKKMLL
jgi:hypothetical protein